MRTNDASNKSSCNADCAQNWPPLLATGNVTAGPGVDSKRLTTIKRDDGSMEVALGGQPLYYFAFDKKPGDATGQGVNAFGGIGYALGANGSAVKGAAPSSTPSSSGTTTTATESLGPTSEPTLRRRAPPTNRVRALNARPPDSTDSHYLVVIASVR